MTPIQQSAKVAFGGWGSFFFKPMVASSMSGALGVKTKFERV